jgi:hypothetical protein
MVATTGRLNIKPFGKITKKVVFSETNGQFENKLVWVVRWVFYKMSTFYSLKILIRSRKSINSQNKKDKL